MPTGTIKPGNRDFEASWDFSQLFEGAEPTGPKKPLPKIGTKITCKDGLFTYFIPPETPITEKNAYMFTHNMQVLKKKAEAIDSGAKESRG